MKYPSSPEMIASVRTVDTDGDDARLGDRITSVMVYQDKQKPLGEIQIDVRDFKRGVNLIIEIPYPEFVAALASAALNAERDLP